jgi:hypothetical protein
MQNSKVKNYEIIFKQGITYSELTGFLDFGHSPEFSTTRKQDVSETGSVSRPQVRGMQTPTLLGPLDRANLSHSFVQ